MDTGCGHLVLSKAKAVEAAAAPKGKAAPKPKVGAIVRRGGSDSAVVLGMELQGKAKQEVEAVTKCWQRQ